MDIRKTLGTLCVAAAAIAAHGTYRPLGAFAGPNSWTYQFYLALADAANTGYPILYIDVNSATCAHCHVFNENTLSSSEFRALENDLVFYCVMTDDAFTATSGGAALFDRYYQYYNSGGGYPLVAVIAKDGSVYGSFTSSTTDNRNVAADLRKLIEELSIKQIGKVVHADGTEVAGAAPTTTAPSAPTKPTTLAGWIAVLKGRSNGVVFDAAGNVAGTLSFNCSAKGRVNAKVTSLNGTSQLKAVLELDANANPLLSAGGMRLVYDNDHGLWVGEMNGGKVFAGKTNAKRYDGLYTLAANVSAAPGYLTLTARNGKGKVSGLLNGRNKISVNGTGIVLPARVVAANIPAWNLGADIAIYPVIKANGQISGAVVATASGAATGRVHAVGADWEVSGGKWSESTSLAPLNGSSVKVGGYEIPVVVTSASKLAAGANAYGAKVQAQVRKGIFKGSLTLPEGRLSFEGALIGSGSNLHGIGVSFGIGVHAVTLGNVVEECDECTVRD